MSAGPVSFKASLVGLEVAVPFLCLLMAALLYVSVLISSYEDPHCFGLRPRCNSVTSSKRPRFPKVPF